MYIVAREGDTLRSIATRFHTSVDWLRLNNKIRNDLVIGDNIIVPYPGEQH